MMINNLASYAKNPAWNALSIRAPMAIIVFLKILDPYLSQSSNKNLFGGSGDGS